MGERVATNRFTTSTLSPELYTLFVVALTDVIVAQQGTVVHGDSAVSGAYLRLEDHATGQRSRRTPQGFCAA